MSCFREMTSPQVENKAKSKRSGLETAKVKTSGDDVKEVEKEESSEKSGSEDGEEENSSVKEEKEQDENAKSDNEDVRPVDEKEEEKLSRDISQSNSVEKIKILEKEAPDKKVPDDEKVFDDKTSDKSNQKSAKSESDEKDGPPEDSSPADNEETKEVAKEEEEEKQQGVKRRVEEEAGGTSRKVVRQSVSVSRLADMELLASLSSSQPGLLKREREEEEEQEQEGEPDSKKSNTVEEEESKDVQKVEKEVGRRKEKVEVSEKEKAEKKAEKVVEAPVVASTKLRDAALEASFSSSRSKHKVEMPAVETREEDQSFQEIMSPPHNLTSPTPLPVPIIPPPPTSLSTPSHLPPAEPSVKKKEASPSPTFKETKQIIGAKELQNEKALQRKRLNKMLTIFEDQTTVKVAADEQAKTQKFEDSLKVLENQNKLKEPPPFATSLPRLPSHDEAM